MLRPRFPLLLDQALSASVMWPLGRPQPDLSYLIQSLPFLFCGQSHTASHAKRTHLPLRRSSPYLLHDVEIHLSSFDFWKSHSQAFMSAWKIAWTWGPRGPSCLWVCIQARWAGAHLELRVWGSHLDLQGGGWDIARKLSMSCDAQDRRNQFNIWKKLHINLYKLTCVWQTCIRN